MEQSFSSFFVCVFVGLRVRDCEVEYEILPYSNVSAIRTSRIPRYQLNLPPTIHKERPFKNLLFLYRRILSFFSYQPRVLHPRSCRVILQLVIGYHLSFSITNKKYIRISSHKTIDGWTDLLSAIAPAVRRVRIRGNRRWRQLAFLH